MRSGYLARKASAAMMACYRELFSGHHLSSACQPHHSFALSGIMLLQKMLWGESLYFMLETLQQVNILSIGER